MYDRTVRMKAVDGAEAVASIVEPYFEREWFRFSGHEYTPTSAIDDKGLQTTHAIAPKISTLTSGTAEAPTEDDELKLG